MVVVVVVLLLVVRLKEGVDAVELWRQSNSFSLVTNVESISVDIDERRQRLRMDENGCA